MSDYGLVAKTAQGEVLFDTRAEHTLFYVDEQHIDGSALSSSGTSFSYPALAGKKISAFLQSPYETGRLSEWVVLSCRVTYPGGIPTVQVYFDKDESIWGTLPKCDGYLVVFCVGANQ